MNEPPPLRESHRCSRCGATIQPAANFCHACGAALGKPVATPQVVTDNTRKSRPKNRPLLATLIALIFIGITLYAIYTGLYEQRQHASKASPSPAPTASPTATSVASAAPWYRREATVVAVTIASPSKEALQTAQDYWEQGDMEAYKKFCALGSITNLKKGTKVEVLDYTWFSGLVKVRPRGSIVEFWTFDGAIKKENQ
jgi:hypothetical protein